MRSRPVSNPESYTLQRGEMMAAGVPAPELPFFRDWARGRLPVAYFEIDEPLERAGALLDQATRFVAWLRKTSPARAQDVERGIEHARALHAAQLASMRQRQVRRMPRMPDPMSTGAVPTVIDEDAPTRSQHAPTSSTQPDTDGEEHWDPAWGDPNMELPPPRPQGMRRLPQSAPPTPKRFEPGGPPGTPKKTRPGGRKRGSTERPG